MFHHTVKCYSLITKEYPAIPIRAISEKYVKMIILVDVQLDAPLRKVLLSPKDVSVEIMTICSQLESLCKQYTVRYLQSCQTVS